MRKTRYMRKQLKGKRGRGVKRLDEGAGKTLCGKIGNQ